MCETTCDYIAQKSEPEKWHGEYPGEWFLDRETEEGGLGIETWRCPHPKLEGEDYCVFHTRPEDVPDAVDESEEMLAALGEIGQSPFNDGPEHRGQFIGATIGPVNLAGVTILATDEHDLRFDHAVFLASGADLNFRQTAFVTRGTGMLSFARTEFLAEDGGELNFTKAEFGTGQGAIDFRHASFQTGEKGGRVNFKNARFETGKGDINFWHATFKSEGEGRVNFMGGDFRTSVGNIEFSGVKFQAACADVYFRDATFRADERGGDIKFKDSVFEAGGDGKVYLRGTQFRANNGCVDFAAGEFATDEGRVDCYDITVESDGDGEVNFSRAMFATEEGDLYFASATFETGTGVINVSYTTFEAVEGEINFSGTMFETGEDKLEFHNTDFRTRDGGGDVNFTDATFRAGEADTSFRGTTFEADGRENEGTIQFQDAKFETCNEAGVDFKGAKFRTGEKGDVCFERAKFKPEYSGDVYFADAVFSTAGQGCVNFRDATFTTEDEGMVYFESSTFSSVDSDLVFEKATFSAGGGAVNFLEATFETGAGDVVFADTTFESECGGNVTFAGARFESGESSNHVYFAAATFKTGDETGKVDFRYVFFIPGRNGYVDFRSGDTKQTTVQGNGTLSFEDAKFTSTARFDTVTIASSTVLTFSGARFESGFVLLPNQDTHSIHGRLDFSDASFAEKPNFHGRDIVIERDGNVPDEKTSARTFADSVDFSGTQFRSGVEFGEFVFPTETSFAGAELSGANFINADLSGVSLERATLNRAELLGTNLTGAKLYGALLGDARVNHKTRFWPVYNELVDSDYTVSLTDTLIPGDSPIPDHTTGLKRVPGLGTRYAHWKAWLRQGRVPYCRYDPRYDTIDDDTLPDRDDSETAELNEDRLEKAAEVYGTIETLARDNSLQQLASEAFVGRKDVQRYQYWRVDNLGRQWLMWIRSIVPNGIARYGESPWRVLATGLVVVLGSGLAYWAFDLIKHQDTGNPATFLESMYFSALTFTTLGYGDFRPANTWGQALAVSETAIGVTMLAILVFVFGRRATR